jgi:hypothetical protein
MEMRTAYSPTGGIARLGTCRMLQATGSLRGVTGMWRDIAFFIMGFMLGVTAAFWVLIFLARS